MWEDYHIFLITPLVFARLLLDEIYHLIELPFDNWWCDVSICLFTWWFDSSFFLKQFETGNRWVWTRLDYPPCITSKPSNLVYFTTRVPDTSDTNATRVRHERHERHEWKTLVLITTQMKTYFHTPIFTIWQVKDYKERNNFILRTTFWKCLVPL